MYIKDSVLKGGILALIYKILRKLLMISSMKIIELKNSVVLLMVVIKKMPH